MEDAGSASAAAVELLPLPVADHGPALYHPGSRPLLRQNGWVSTSYHNHRVNGLYRKNSRKLRLWLGIRLAVWLGLGLKSHFKKINC